MEDKKRINSKAKGSEYELKMAKVLGAWWGEKFNRTPASGGLHWKADNRVAGDIVTPPNSVYPFVTELKKREAWDFSHLLKGTGEMESYWDQVIEDSIRVNLKPLLIFAKNFSPNYLMITLDDLTSILVADYEAKIKPFPYFIIHKVDKPSRIICILDDFIKNVTKQDIVKAFKL